MRGSSTGGGEQISRTRNQGGGAPSPSTNLQASREEDGRLENLAGGARGGDGGARIKSDGEQ